LPQPILLPFLSTIFQSDPLKLSLVLTVVILALKILPIVKFVLLTE
jgi:hypothetical protein